VAAITPSFGDDCTHNASAVAEPASTIPFPGSATVPIEIEFPGSAGNMAGWVEGRRRRPEPAHRLVIRRSFSGPGPLNHFMIGPGYPRLPWAKVRYLGTAWSNRSFPCQKGQIGHSLSSG